MSFVKCNFKEQKILCCLQVRKKIIIIIIIVENMFLMSIVHCVSNLFDGALKGKDTKFLLKEHQQKKP